MSKIQRKIYICRYGQTDINLCPLMDKECEFRHDCDLRQVIDYDTYQAKEQECLTLINKDNRLEEENNMLAFLLEGKNNQYNWAMQKYEELKKQLNGIQDTCPYFNDCSYRQCDKDRIANYKQALDEIEEFCVVYSYDHDAYETVYKHILDIINKERSSNEKHN